MHVELDKWANEIIDYYNPIAKTQNLEYYPLQSPINLTNTEVLIIGVNPRSNGNYESQSDTWNFIDGRMTSERLLNGNPAYSTKNSWRLIIGLKQIPFLNRVFNSGTYTYMNYFYLSSKDASEMKLIDNFAEIVCFSKNKLVELVNIIKPKLIIVLGTKDGLDIVSEIRTQTHLKKKHTRILTEGSLNGIKMYGIPHSSRYYAYDVREALDLSLTALWEGNAAPSYTFTNDDNKKNLDNKPKIDILKINEQLLSYQFTFSKYQDNEGVYEALYNGIEGDVLDFRLDLKSNKKYISFRSKDKLNKSFFNHLKGKDLYTTAFSKEFKIESESWLVKKELTNYTDDQSIEHLISQDIIAIINLISSNT